MISVTYRYVFLSIKRNPSICVLEALMVLCVPYSLRFSDKGGGQSFERLSFPYAARTALLYNTFVQH